MARVGETLLDATMVPLRRNTIVGHRGFPSRALENTLPSFEAAFAAGARGIECDVWPTRDGHPVVIHDATLERTHGLPERVDALARDRLRTIPYLTEPELRVLDLDDVLILSERHDGFVLVELKGESRELPGAVAASIERTRTENRVACLSFSQALVSAMQALEPRVPCAPLFEHAPSAVEPSWDFVVVEARGLTEAFVRRAARVGVPVACFGVDSTEIDAALDRWGVGLRITDRPDLRAVRTH